MKVRYRFFRKARVIFYWLFKLGDGIGVHCQYCNSLELDFIKQEESENCYISKYKCKRCGATATNFEMWKRGGK